MIFLPHSKRQWWMEAFKAIKEFQCLTMWGKTSKSIIHIVKIMKWLIKLVEDLFQGPHENICLQVAKRTPHRYAVNLVMHSILEAERNRIVANSISSIKICSGNNGGLKWLWYGFIQRNVCEQGTYIKWN